MKAVFLDRDGTLIIDPPDLRVDKIEKLKLFSNTVQALAKLAKLDYQVFVVTNQAGIAEGLLTESDFNTINDAFIRRIEPSGIKIIRTYMCPHAEQDNCSCKKPKPALLLKAAQEHNIDLSQSWMIGDRISDIMAGINEGTKTILVQTANTPVKSDEATYTTPTISEAVDCIAAAQ